MRPLLLGMNNPHSDNPRWDLAPYPDNSSGWRLWKMIDDRVGISKRDYMKVFARHNLLHSRTWDKRKVKDAAFAATFFTKPGVTVVLLGDDVRRAMNLFNGGKIQKILIHPQVVNGVTYRCVPHPSGRNLFYNDPIQRELVAMLLVDLYKQGRDLYG